MTYAEVVAGTPWIPSWHETGACMDRRHILWLYEVLKRTGVQRTLEIGVYSGASSSAFVAAGIPDAHFCDIATREDAMSVVSGRGTFHQLKGCEVLKAERTFDLVFVDGNHALDVVTEEVDALLANPPHIIVAHDVNSTAAGYPYCEGGEYLWHTLEREGWTCVVDAKERGPEEMTKRGMLVATKDGRNEAHIWDALNAIL